MVNVQQYDVFYKEFRSIISDIEREKGEDDRLLVNMASGTPAMKSALLIMATLAEYRFLPIQVSTPQKKAILSTKNDRNMMSRQTGNLIRIIQKMRKIVVRK